MSRVSAALVAMILAVAACTSGSDGTEPASSTPDASAPRGGTLRLAVPDFFVDEVDLDPQRAYGGAGWGLDRCCLLRTLYSYDGTSTKEGGGQLRPDLAVGSPEVSPDGLTWTIRLRQGLRFAPPFEGAPITAEDLVRALERTARVSSPAVGYGFYYGVIRGFDDYGSGGADSIVGLETPDDRTLVVRLDHVTGDLAYRFSLPATSPIPEGAADGHDVDYARFLVASGPYMIEGSERLDPAAPPDEQRPAAGFTPPVLTEDGAVETPGLLVLVRNPSWEPATDRLRAALPDRIELTLGGLDDEEIVRLVDAGEVDLGFGGSSPFEQVERYRDDPAMADQLFEHPNDYSFAVTMNLAVPPFDDVHVRRAVASAIDKAALLDIVARPPHLPLGHSAVVAAHAAPDVLERGLLQAFDPYPYAPEAARAEMRASAYDRTGDGRCDTPVCRNVRAVVSDVGVNPGVARAIRDDLADLGIELELEIHPGDRFIRLISDPRERIAVVIPDIWGPDYPEGGGWFLALFDRSGCCNNSLIGATPEELRRWGYSITSVPSAEDRLQACLQRRGVARTQCWAELDQYLTMEVVSRIPYLFIEHAQVVSERVVAYSFDQFSGLPALDRIALASGSE